MKKQKGLSFWEQVKGVQKWTLRDALGIKYKLNRTVFIFIFIFLGFFILATLYDNSFDFSQKIYYTCPVDSKTSCDNPYYMKSDCPGDYAFCSTRSFNPGYTFGDPEPFVYRWNTAIYLTIMLGLLINHFAFNWRWKNE